MDLIKPLSPPEPRDVLKPERFRTTHVLPTATPPARQLRSQIRPRQAVYERRLHNDRRRKSVPVKVERRLGDRRGTQERGALWREAYLKRKAPIRPYQQKRLKSLLNFSEDPKWHEKRRGKGVFLDERV